MTSSPLCPICNTKNCQLVNKFNKSNLFSCIDCKLQFLHPLNIKEIHQIYDSNYFQGKLADVKGYRNYPTMQAELSAEAVRKLAFIQQFSSHKNLLDVGTGTGIFLSMAKKQGYQVSGNDISHVAEKAFKDKGINCYFGSIEEDILPQNRFEIITAWDVIEHVPDIGKAMRNLSKALKLGGYLFLTSPNTESFDAKLMRRYWYGYQKIPEHIYFFNRSSITKLLEDYGFEVVAIKPWGFVRSIGFILEKLSYYWKGLSIIFKLFTTKKIMEKAIYLPLTDFMVVAKKVR